MIFKKTTIEITPNEHLTAVVCVDQETKQFSLDIETLKYLLKSKLLNTDVDCTHELYINAEKRNFAVELLMAKARIDSYEDMIGGSDGS